MKIVVLGGKGLIGSKTVDALREQGHDVVAASSRSGVNSVTGEGLADALKGAEVVVDVTNSPSFEDKAVMDFFEKSTQNLLAAAADAGVKHLVALSVVGTKDLQESGYFRAKQRQEDLINAGKVPYTIVQATQFFEFIGGIADSGEKDGEVHLSTGHMQPISAPDVSTMVAEVAVSEPLNGTVEIAGDHRARLCDIVTEYMTITNDKRKVVSSAEAKYFGMKLQEGSLCPAGKAKIAPTKFQDWLKTVEKTAATSHR